MGYALLNVHSSFSVWWPDCPGNKERIVNCNRSHNGSTHFEGNAKGLCLPLLESLSILLMKQKEYLVRNTRVSWKKIKNIIYFFWNANYLRTIYLLNIYTFTYTYTQTYTHIHICVHIYAYAHSACIYIHMYTYIHIHHEILDIDNQKHKNI